MMNFSDETVEKCATVYAGWGVLCNRVALKASLSSLTIADLMQVEAVRELVKMAGMAHKYQDSMLSQDWGNLAKALTPFTEPKQ